MTSISLSALVEFVDVTAVGFVLEKKAIVGRKGLATCKGEQGKSEFGRRANVTTKYSSARVEVYYFTHLSNSFLTIILKSTLSPVFPLRIYFFKTMC